MWYFTPGLDSFPRGQSTKQWQIEQTSALKTAFITTLVFWLVIFISIAKHMEHR